ncbi:MAG: mechanosensitive ion channel [Leptospiraceae bacterium]
MGRFFPFQAILFLSLFSYLPLQAESPNPATVEPPGSSGEEITAPAETPARESVEPTAPAREPAPAVNPARPAQPTQEASEETSNENQTPTAESIRGPEALLAYVKSEDFRRVMEAIGWSVLLVLTLLISIWLITYIFQMIYSRLEGLAGRLATGIRFRNSEIVQASTVQGVLRGILRLIHLVLNIFLIILVADFIIGLFPGAENSATASLIRSIIRASIATMVFVTIFRAVRHGFDFLERSLPVLQSRFIPNLEFQNTVLLSRDRIMGALQIAVQIIKVLTLVVVSYFYLASVFGLFDATSNWASLLLGYVKVPLIASGLAVAQYLPNLFFIILVILITRYSVKIAGFLFREVEKETIKINGFYPDWARPTHKILTVVLIAFAAIVAFPYLPGANSDAFKGISIFLGFMVSLGSSAIIANIMAGIIITYMRPFRVGDRVKIGETEGDITEKTLLVTRIRTVKNVEITIPNGAVLASHIVNYSSTIERKDTDGLILHSTVTIGYDVPYQKVQDLLIRAAGSVPGVKESPAPFVLQTSLDDYYISYQVNCYTDEPHQMARIYSSLHQSILEEFGKSGVEIMSPHYYALRDGNEVTIPPDQRPPTYRPPSFRIDTNKEDPS